MSRGNHGATRWVLTCPDCGETWCEVTGHGEWRKLGPWSAEHPAPEGLTRYPGHPRSISLPPAWELPVSEWTAEGPQRLAEPGEPVRRPPVLLTRQCFHCYDLAIRNRWWGLGSLYSDAQFCRNAAWATEVGLKFKKAQPPDEDGTKECYLCRRRFVARRSDACYCSPACRKAMYRRLKVWRDGKWPSSAMGAHDRERRSR